jgi:hypothetical protein
VEISNAGLPWSIRCPLGPHSPDSAQPSTLAVPARLRVRLIRIQRTADSESERGSSGFPRPLGDLLDWAVGPERLVLLSTTPWSCCRLWVDLGWGFGARCDARGTPLDIRDDGDSPLAAAPINTGSPISGAIRRATAFSRPRFDIRNQRVPRDALRADGRPGSSPAHGQCGVHPRA